MCGKFSQQWNSGKHSELIVSTTNMLLGFFFVCLFLKTCYGNDMKLQYGTFRLDVRKMFFIERIRWKRLPWEVVMAPRLPLFKKHLDYALRQCSLILGWSCVEPGGSRTWWCLWVPSNLGYSMILNLVWNGIIYLKYFYSCFMDQNVFNVNREYEKNIQSDNMSKYLNSYSRITIAFILS